MDYLAFGLLAGSLTVIASFVVRDGMPHLSAIGEGSRLGRLSRAETPLAWGRWCADAGLVLAGAGTCVLIITVAALLAGLDDGAGNILVGLSVAAAAVASALGLRRLGQRLRTEAGAELGGELEPTYPAEAVRATVANERADPSATVDVSHEPTGARAAVDDDVWGEELPTWSPPIRPVAPVDVPVADLSPTPVAGPVPESGQAGSSWADPDSVPPAPPPTRGRTRLRVIEERAEPPPLRGRPPAPSVDEGQGPPAIGGLFSSPLLADIGLTSPDGDGAEARFRSPLLSDLHDVGAEDDSVVGTGSDLLIDEAPAPVQTGGRTRDGVDDR